MAMQDGRSELREEPWETKISLRVFRGSFVARFAFPAEISNPSTFKRVFKMRSVYPRSQPARAPNMPGRVKKYNGSAPRRHGLPQLISTSFLSYLWDFFSLGPRALSWP